MLKLIVPDLEHLPPYIAALNTGWSPDNVRLAAAAEEELEKIRKDAKQFVDLLTDREALGGPVTLPDGSTVPRLPGFRRWLWDGDFCGSIGFRWQPGTSSLPEHVLGHIGYAVVPWKRNRGYATQALGVLLFEIREMDFDYVELTADPDNIPSQRVILSNGGVMVERFRKGEAYGSGESLRFRIDLNPSGTGRKM